MPGTRPAAGTFDGPDADAPLRRGRFRVIRVIPGGATYSGRGEEPTYSAGRVTRPHRSTEGDPVALTTNRTGSARRGGRLAATTAGGALALLLAACGSTAGGGTDAAPDTQKLSPVELVAAAAEKTTGQTAKISIDVSTSVGGMSLPITGTGQMDSAKKALSMQITTKVPGLGAMKLKQIVIDDTVYMSGFPGAPKGRWAELSATELQGLGSAGSGVTDPADSLKLLTDISDGVTEAGTAKVNGVSTTKYTGSMNLAKAAEASGAEAADTAELTAELKKMGLSSVPFEFYVDDQGLPARMVTTMKGSAEGQEFALNSTVDFTDWGAPVTITAPKDTVPLQELMGGSGLGG